MKLSDYIVTFLSDYSDVVFLLSGGSIMHLVDSFSYSKKFKNVCCHHEQTAATAAEAYSKVTNKLGIVLVTSGPGATNAITGVAAAWQSSTPIVVISGQVKTADLMPRNKKGKPTVRQMGFQEINIVDIVKPITKYAVLVKKVEKIKYHLEKAIYLAKEGRPGPVWLDIPIDISRTDIDTKSLESFSKPPQKKYNMSIDKASRMLRRAKKPLLFVGNGVRLSKAQQSLDKFLNKSQINVITSLFTSDLIPIKYNHYLGVQGMRGHKSANYAVDNCDVLLVLGERLSIAQTSYEYNKFARQAKVIMVDIDPGELEKPSLNVDLPINTDAKMFLDNIVKSNLKLRTWRLKFESGICSNELQCDKSFLNIYYFMEKLNDYLSKKQNFIVTTSCGQARFIPHQILRFSETGQFVSTTSMRQMGCDLPHAIGSAIGRKDSLVLCMAGDGSIMLNLQELETIKHHKLPVIVFILNNNAYASIRNTHTRYFNRVSAADPESGVSIPNYEKVANAFGIKYEQIKDNSEVKKLNDIFKGKMPIVCELMIDPKQSMPKVWSAGELRKV